MKRKSVVEQFAVSSEINVTPMIDVMLVLLIIFMVVTPGLAVGVLPRAKAALPAAEDRVTLGIDREGRFFLDGRKGSEVLAPVRLTARLAAEHARRKDDHVLYLKADQATSYANVLTALDAARDAGFRTVGMITEQPPREES
jgi:biopolymer transport protein TolR